MIKSVFNALATAARRSLQNWRVMIVFFALYVVLLVAGYLFLVTREASLWQLLLTLALAIAAPALFFILQAMGVNYAQSETQLGALWRRSSREFWKLFLISLPLVLFTWLLVYALDRVQFSLSTAAGEAARATLLASRRSAGDSTDWARWLGVAITGLRFLLLFIALPLATIHLWIATTREGLGATLKGAGRILARAFAPRAVLAYALGLAVFGGIFYFLVSTPTPVKNPWVEMGLLGARLALALAFIVFGWMITLGALAEITVRNVKSRKD